MAKIKSELTYKQQHRCRLNYAKKIGSCLLYESQIFMLHYVLDALYIILQHVINVIGALIIM